MIDTKDFAGVPDDYEVPPEINNLDPVEGVQVFINRLASKDKEIDPEIKDFSVKFSQELGSRLEKIANRAKRPLLLLLSESLCKRIYRSQGYQREKKELFTINTSNNVSKELLHPKFYAVAQAVALFHMRRLGLEDDVYTDYQAIGVNRIKDQSLVRIYPSKAIPRLQFDRNVFIDTDIQKVTSLSWYAQEITKQRKFLWFSVKI